MEMNFIKEEKFTVQACQCYSGGYMKISSLMQSMQEIASVHVEQLGFGYGDLDKKSVYWALSNIRVDFSEMPKWNEEIILKTWPSGCSRLIATREFVGTGQNNRNFFKAGSQWMILSKDSHRPKDFLRSNLGLPVGGEKILSDKMKRLESHKNYNQAGQMYVPNSSIDLNGHVNYTEYIRWGFDILKKACQVSDKISSLQATYLSEVFEGDELELLVVSDKNVSHCVLIRRPNTLDTVFLMEIS